MTTTPLRLASASFALRVASITLAVLLAGALTVAAQDPRTEPFPQRDVAEAFKVFVVQLRFTGRQQVSLISAKVVRGLPPERVSAPPLLRARVLMGDDCPLEEFNTWHPLWSFIETDSGDEQMAILASGESRIIVPFNRTARKLEVIDRPVNRRLISVNLATAVADYCSQNSQDRDCRLDIALAVGPRLPRLRFRLSGPPSFRAGEDFGRRVKFEACNAGEAPATGTADDPSAGYTLQVVMTPTVGQMVGKAAVRVRRDILLGGPIVKTKTLKSGQKTSVKFNAVIPKDTPPGTYCVNVLSKPAAKDSQPAERSEACTPLRIVK